MDLKWLAEQLDRPGFSQAGLAKALGKSPSAVSRILSGERQIKVTELEKITQYLGVPAVPPSEEEEQSYHALLGRAVADWNSVELLLPYVLLDLLRDGRTPHRTGHIVMTVFEHLESRAKRVEAITSVLKQELADHRNELDEWLALAAKIVRAGTRRDAYVHAVTLNDALGRSYGMTSSLSSRGRADLPDVTREMLLEDAEHFQDIYIQLLHFSHRLGELAPKLGDDDAKSALT